jgi:hypothetical protein
MPNYAGNSYSVKINWRANRTDRFTTSTGVVVAKSLADAAEVAYVDLCGRQDPVPPATNYSWIGTLAGVGGAPDCRSAVKPNIPATPVPIPATEKYSDCVQVYEIRRIENVEDSAAVKDY